MGRKKKLTVLDQLKTTKRTRRLTPTEKQLIRLQLDLSALAERVAALEMDLRPPRSRYGCPRRPVLGRPTGRR